MYRLVSTGTIEELTYMRQIYKLQVREDLIEESGYSGASFLLIYPKGFLASTETCPLNF